MTCAFGVWFIVCSGYLLYVWMLFLVGDPGRDEPRDEGNDLSNLTGRVQGIK